MMYLSYKYHRHIPIQKYLWALNRWQLTWWESCRCCSRNTRGMKAPSKTSLHPYFFSLTSVLFLLVFAFTNFEQAKRFRLYSMILVGCYHSITEMLVYHLCYLMSLTSLTTKTLCTNIGGTLITGGVSTTCTTGADSPGETGASWCPTTPAIDRVCHQSPSYRPPPSFIMPPLSQSFTHLFRPNSVLY